jgi:hypothetical protein
MGAKPVSGVENDTAKGLRDFLLEDYKLKVEYLTGHFSRMWTRFNFFISLETLVAGALVAAATTERPLDNLWLVAILGLVISFCWYVVGATDRYLIATYRSQIRSTLLELARNRVFDVVDDPIRLRGGTLQLLNKPLACFRDGKSVDDDFRYPFTGGTKEMEDIKRDVLQWRIRRLSVTTWPAFFPLIAIILWIVALIVTLADFD